MNHYTRSLKRIDIKMGIKHWGLIGLIAVLMSCSSGPEEEYFDYFYTTKTTPERKDFTYILYLGSEGDHRIPDDSRQSVRFDEKQGRNPSNQGPKRSGKAKVDDFMSLSFRMEEEAFKRLEIKLDEKDYCTEDPDYSLSEYTWLTYTIKGSCG